MTFAPGRYRFYAQADDGIRVRLNDKVIVDKWRDNDGSQVYKADLSVEGTQNVVVEYYERGGDARIYFWWSHIGN